MRSDDSVAMQAGNPACAGLPIPANPLWKPLRDSVYLQEVGSRLESDEPVVAAAIQNDTLYVGGKNGVRRLEGEILTPAGGPTGHVVRLKTLNGILYVFLREELWRYDGRAWVRVSRETFVDGCEHRGDVVLASKDHLYRVEEDSLIPLSDAASPQPILGVVSYAETLYVRHKVRLGFLAGRTFEYEDVQDWNHLPLGAVTRDMMAFGSRLFVPTSKGLGVLRGMSWDNVTGDKGLCYEDTTCVARGFENDDYWVGTTRGAIRCVDGEFQYFGYERWIPGDKVNAIVCGDRVVYIATDGGLGIVRYEPYTLEKKAMWYERWLEEWGMRRLGFTSSLTWDETRGEWVRFISDNDGGWTAHLLNGLCFKYAVTRDPQVREQAVEVFRALKWCEEITPISGFPARSIATIDEPSVLSSTGSGGLPSEWHPTPDGKWLWKGDTSSDEVDSHIQATVIFYELVAEGKEKEAAREHLRRIVGYIVDGGWVLRDVDGKPTRWARWDPAYLKSPAGVNELGLNSMEALSLITAAYAVTGDAKFSEAKQQLLDWGYHTFALRQKLVFPSVTHFDDRLAFLAYHPLLTYETEPELRAIFRRSLERSWEVKRVENMPWFNYIYGALTGNDMDNERSLENLRAWPLDCRSYTFTNSHRADLRVPEGYINYVSDWKSMSGRDIGPTTWADDFLQLDGGGSDEHVTDPLDENTVTRSGRIHGGGRARNVNDPSAFIDAYWMARYYGMILPPEVDDERLLTVPASDVRQGARPYDGPARPDLGF